MAGKEISSWGDFVLSVAEYIPVVVGAHIAQDVIKLGISSLILVAAGYFGSKFALRQIAHGQFPTKGGVVTTTTSYWPATETIDGEDVTVYDQEITNVNRIRLSHVLNPDENKQGKAVHGVVKKAQKLARANPEKSAIAYAHLSDVLEDSQVEGMREAIVRLNVGYFSQIFNSEVDITKPPPSAQHRPVHNRILPLLVVEPDANGGYADKILYINIVDGKLPELATSDRVRYPDLDADDLEERFIFDSEHPHADRYRLIESVLSDLQKPEHQWMLRMATNTPVTHYRHIETEEVVVVSSHADPSLAS